jgi:iron complex outermembrane receptor protein
MIRLLPRALACALALAPPAAFAAWEARLLTPAGEPAAGFTVAVVGRPLAVPCDEAGRFALDPPPAVPFVLVATSPAGEVAAPLEVRSLEQTELRLIEVLRESVTVVSGVAPSLELLPGSAATVLTREELEQRSPQRLYQALESVAGASKLGDGADSVPALRNLGRGRTLILIDGARVSAERRAGPSATFLDPASLATVEVLRGPGSVVYGSDAFGGVLNAVTRDPEPGRFSLRWGLEAGLGALDERSGFLAASFGVGDGALLVEAHARDAGDAEAGGGEAIFNSSYGAAGGAVRFAAPLGSGRLRAALTVERVDDLGKAAIDSRAIRALYPREDADRLTVSWLGAPAAGWETLEAALFFGTYRIVLDRDRAPTATSGRRIDRSDTDADDASLRLVGARAAGGGRLQLGLDASGRLGVRSITEQARFAADGLTVVWIDRTVSIDDASQVDTGLFATWSRPLAERWSLGIGARGDRVETRNEGGFAGDRSISHSALSGNLSVTAGPFAGVTSTLQVARGFRSPTLSDRFFRGPSGRGFVTGNPDLDPETSLQADWANRWSRGRTSVGLFLYRYEIDHLVERYGAGADFFFRNRGSATIEGIEAEVQTAFGGGWSLEAGGALSAGETDGDAAIDDVAAPNLWVNLRRSFGRAFAFGRLQTVAGHDDPGPTELERPGYTIADLGGGIRFSERLEVRLLVRNVGDRRYFASPDEAADRATGRSYGLAVSGRL